MNYSKLYSRLQLAASIGVIIGLLLLIYEIRENNRIAENQAAIEMNSLYNEWSALMTGESLAKLYVKALEDPDALSRDELLRLHYAYTTASQVFKTHHFLLQAGGLSMYPESTLYYDYSNALSGPVARRFVLLNEGDSDSDTSEIIRQAIRDTPSDIRLEYIDSLRPPAEDAGQPD